MGATKRVRNGAWEKDRRQRLNLTFLELSKLLPDHDPTLNIPKVDILTKAIAYIQELRQKYANMADCCFNNAMKSEIAELHKQASNLRLRNEQLAELLRRAEISLPGPPAPHPLPFTTPRKWAGRIRKSDVKNTVIEKETTSSAKKKSNENKMRPRKKVKITPSIKRNLRSSAKPSPAHKELLPTKSDAGNNSTSTPLREIRNVLPVSTSIIAHATGSTTSLVITNTVPKAKLVAINKINITTAPIMATGIQPVLERNPVLSRLGPGALILADGRVVSMPAPPPAQIIVMPRIITNDTTSTTFVNKMPIPAIGSCFRPKPLAKVSQVLLKRKGLGSDSDGVGRPKKMLTNRGKRSEKRTGAKVVKGSCQTQKIVESSQVKVAEPGKVLGTTVNKAVDKDTLGMLNNTNEDKFTIASVAEKINETENLAQKHNICDKNQEINVLSVKIDDKINESCSHGDKIPVSSPSTNKINLNSNANLSDRSKTNHELENDLCLVSNENCSRKMIQTLPVANPLNCLSTSIENNSVLGTTKPPLHIQDHTTEINTGCSQRIDNTDSSTPTCGDVDILKKQHPNVPLSDLSSEITAGLGTVQGIQLIDKEVSCIIGNISTPAVDCYSKHVEKQHKVTEVNFSNIECNQVNEAHQSDLVRRSSSAVNESKNNDRIDAVRSKSPNGNISNTSPCLMSKEIQPSDNRDHTDTNKHKNNEYQIKEKESVEIITESVSSAHEEGQMNTSHKQIPDELPKICKNNQNILSSHSQSSVASSNLEKIFDKSITNEYCNNTKNMKPVNIDNSCLVVIQESASTNSHSSSKSTQITMHDHTCTENSVKNKSSQSPESTAVKKISPETGENKTTNGNKSIIADVSSELTNLFTSDAKLPSCSETLFKDTDRNLFMPLSHSYMDEIRLSLPHGDFSNDLFSSLHVPTGGQHPESISPTAAFLLAFPLVSTSKASDLIADAEVTDSQHATPTTILQIGNIEGAGNELYHQTSMMIDNNLTNIQESLKLNRSTDNSKISNNLKHQKDFDNNFSKLQQLEINDFVRNDTFSRSSNNYKDKKQFSGETDQDLFTSYKKKPNGKNTDFALSTDVSNTFQDKFFEFGSNNTRNNLIQHASVIDTRQGDGNNNQKKDQVPLENMVNSQQAYVSSSQSYSYHTFPNANDCSMGNSNYLASNRVDNVSSKPPQTLPNYQAIPWSSASVTAASNNMNYLSPYCSHQQKPYTSASNKNMHLKTLQNNTEDHRLKEKGLSTGNMLPKFSANFQFNTNNQSNQDIQHYPHTNISDRNFKTDSKSKKQKTNSQRAPVNWMTTPDVRSAMPDINSGPMLPDAMFQPQKEIDFNSVTNNGVFGSSSNIQSTTLPNNNQSLYQNAHFSGVDLQLDFVTMPDISSTNKPLRSLSSVPNSQQNPHYSWSPSKSSIPLLPHIESHMIPSTLPTLVGDLALGTTTPSGPLDNCRSLALPSTPFISDQPSKKCEIKLDTQKQIGRKSSDKECFSDRRNIANRSIQEYCQKTHTHQSTNTTSSFLSVSQLVDHTKTEQNSSRRTSKQSVNKNSSTLSKRNMNAQQQEKPNSIKISSINNNNNNYHTTSRGSLNQRKPDFPVYQESPPVGFLVHPPPYKGGSYSAESLIGEHNMIPPQEQISDLPSFSVGNQFPNQFIHSQKPLASTSSSDYSQQNVQPLEFHQTQHTQNGFNYNAHYPVPSYNPDNDYHLGIDQFYNFNQTSTTSRNPTSCQTSSHGGRDSRGAAHKRAKRREEPLFKCPSNQPVTTTLTNFNLSTIFPEINDKRSVQGTNTFHHSANKPNEGSINRPGINPSLAPQVGMPPHFPPVNLRPQQ